MVSRAFQILSDADKKEKYDRFGGDPDSRFGPGSASTASPFSGFARSPGGRGPMFDDEISPEELFNRFFGGGGMGGPFGIDDAQLQRRRKHNTNSLQVEACLTLGRNSCLTWAAAPASECINLGVDGQGEDPEKPMAKVTTGHKVHSVRCQIFCPCLSCLSFHYCRRYFPPLFPPDLPYIFSLVHRTPCTALHNA